MTAPETPLSDEVEAQCIEDGSSMSYARAIDVCRTLETELAAAKAVLDSAVEGLPEEPTTFLVSEGIDNEVGKIMFARVVRKIDYDALRSAAVARIAALESGLPDDAVQIALLFHNLYEQLAPSFGYETRADTKSFDPDSANGKLMTAVCGQITSRLRTQARAIQSRLAAAEAKCAALEKDYTELIMAVARKWPNETRHQTALRYINSIENRLDTATASANKGRENEHG